MWAIFLNFTHFLQSDIFSKCDHFLQYERFFRVAHFSQCGQFFSVTYFSKFAQLFFSLTRFYSAVDLLHIDPYFKVWPIFPNVTHFSKRDLFYSVWLIFQNVTHFLQCDLHILFLILLLHYRGKHFPFN